MKLFDIYKFLDNVSPFELQESWDNSGLLVGDDEQEISKIALSIDVDEALIDIFRREHSSCNSSSNYFWRIKAVGI